MPNSEADKPLGKLRASAEHEETVPPQLLIKHRPFIFALMIVLVCLIILVNAMRTDASPPIVTTVAAEPETVIVIRQLDGILLANISDGSSVAWRAVSVDQPVCKQTAFETEATVVSDNLIILVEDDIGGRYCFEALADGQPVLYSLSDPIAAFPAFETDADQSLEIVDIQNHGDILMARASRPVYWQSVILAEDAECSEESFAGIPSTDSRLSLVTDLPLSVNEAGHSYCFQAYDHLERAFRIAPSAESDG